MRKIAIASDHAGLQLKAFLLRELKEVELVDLGPSSADSVDYPDYATLVCKKIQSKACELGILVCGSGIGMSIAANKHTGIRAAHSESIMTAKLSAEHNKANVICLGERVTGAHHALEMVRAWLGATFEDRHQRRIDKIHAEEKK